MHAHASWGKKIREKILHYFIKLCAFYRNFDKLLFICILYSFGLFPKWTVNKERFAIFRIAIFIFYELCDRKLSCFYVRCDNIGMFRMNLCWKFYVNKRLKVTRVCGLFRHADFAKWKFKNKREKSEIVLHE